jgi:hypothetical protein
MKNVITITALWTFSYSLLAGSCPYFEPSACLKEAKTALMARLSTLDSSPFKTQAPSIFCGALDNEDAETILYRYHFTKITGAKSLKLNADVEITLNMDECVNASVQILN